MKLHIECLQEKVRSYHKGERASNRENERTVHENSVNLEKLSKIVKTLEEELSNKAEKIKVND